MLGSFALEMVTTCVYIHLIETLCCTNRVLASHVGAKPDEDQEQKPGWLTKLLQVRQIDPGKTSHSQMLSDKDTVYELTSKFSVSFLCFIEIQVRPLKDSFRCVTSGVIYFEFISYIHSLRCVKSANFYQTDAVMFAHCMKPKDYTSKVMHSGELLEKD